MVREAIVRLGEADHFAARQEVLAVTSRCETRWLSDALMRPRPPTDVAHRAIA
jgi:hypothetical protein